MWTNAGDYGMIFDQMLPPQPVGVTSEVPRVGLRSRFHHGMLKEAQLCMYVGFPQECYLILAVLVMWLHYCGIEPNRD